MQYIVDSFSFCGRECGNIHVRFLDSEKKEREGMVMDQREISEGTERTSDAELCGKCGASIMPDQEFCPKCGSPKGKAFCAKCGTELEPGHDFCPKCGHKIGAQVNNENIRTFAIEKNSKKKLMLPLIIGVAAVIVVVLVIALKPPKVESITLAEDTIELIQEDVIQINYTITPEKAQKREVEWTTSDESVATVDKKGNITAVGAGKCTITANAQEKTDTIDLTVISKFEGYLADADYENAYLAAANDAEREAVLFENAAAVESSFAAENLKDSESFSLREGYYRKASDKEELVLKVAGNNSFGNTVTNYWYFTKENGEKEWSLFITLSDLDDEEEYSWDDASEKLEKLLKNMTKETVIDIMNNGVELSKDGIKRINTLFAEDKLEEIELINLNDSEESESV